MNIDHINDINVTSSMFIVVLPSRGAMRNARRSLFDFWLPLFSVVDWLPTRVIGPSLSSCLIHRGEDMNLSCSQVYLRVTSPNGIWTLLSSFPFQIVIHRTTRLQHLILTSGHAFMYWPTWLNFGDWPNTGLPTILLVYNSIRLVGSLRPKT